MRALQGIRWKIINSYGVPESLVMLKIIIPYSLPVTWECATAFIKNEQLWFWRVRFQRKILPPFLREVESQISDPVETDLDLFTQLGLSEEWKRNSEVNSCHWHRILADHEFIIELPGDHRHWKWYRGACDLNTATLDLMWKFQRKFNSIFDSPPESANNP
jgi:hypothetical protein